MSIIVRDAFAFASSLYSINAEQFAPTNLKLELVFGSFLLSNQAKILRSKTAGLDTLTN